MIFHERSRFATCQQEQGNAYLRSYSQEPPGFGHTAGIGRFLSYFRLIFLFILLYNNIYDLIRYVDLFYNVLSFRQCGDSLICICNCKSIFL